MPPKATLSLFRLALVLTLAKVLSVLRVFFPAELELMSRFIDISFNRLKSAQWQLLAGLSHTNGRQSGHWSLVYSVNSAGGTLRRRS